MTAEAPPDRSARRSTLLMPLVPLPPHLAPDRAEPVSPSRSLSLDAAPGLARWSGALQAAPEACLMLDATGRVVALSPSAADLLDLQPDTALGALLSDLLAFVDFSLAALSSPDAAADSPPLRALRTGGMARGLLRRRRPDGSLATYDVVGVGLRDRAGVLAFVSEV